jgi:hypothetical protein
MVEQLRHLIQVTAHLLMAAGFEAQARRLLATPVNIKARLSCLFRTLRAIELTIDARWGTSMRQGKSLTGYAIEGVACAHLGAVLALNWTDDDEEVMSILIVRLDELRAVACIDGFMATAKRVKVDGSEADSGSEVDSGEG